MYRLRPWLFCLVFFIAANVWVERYFTIHGADVYPVEALQKRAKYYTENAIRKLLQIVAADHNPKVIILGDSFLWGTGVADDQVASEHLKQLLSTDYPDLSVWNLALPASHAADVYAMLKVVLPMEPTALIVNTNYYFFTIPEDRNHMTQKWMLPILEDEHEYEQLLAALGINAFELRLQRTLQSILPVYRHKLELNLQILGTPNGQDYITGEIARLYTKLKQWSPITLPAGTITEKSHREFYEPHRITDDQINMIFAKKIADLIDSSHVPTYVFSTPQNPTVLGSLITNDIFNKNMVKIDRMYENRSFLYENLHGIIDPRYQRDNVHLNPEGHVALAQLLYDRLLPLLEQEDRSP